VSADTITLTPPLLRYVRAISVREPDILFRIREETRATQPSAGMQISPEQGQLLGVLVRLAGARRILEIGTFTGYSSTAMALAMGPQGRLVTCDVSEPYTSIAAGYWREAGIEERIELRLGPALESLAGLLEAGEAGAFDLAFIDADKANGLAYYELALELVRAGGLVAVDNTLWSGAVIDPQDESPSTEAIRELNERIARDDRVDVSLVPIGDGLTLVVKR
jgi:predicted O-methyltransferase YrrM